MTIVNNLYSVNSALTMYEWSNSLSPSNSDILKASNEIKPSFCISEDTITVGQNETKKEASNNEKLSVPVELINTPINFQVNSYIYYLSFNHFVKEDSKRFFIQGWLMEKDLQKLSLITDSLRKAYSTASNEEREIISARILQSEEKTIALNEEIPVAYEKAREEEDRYWQSASMDEISKFQQKLSRYADSIEQKRQQTVNTEIPDTINMYIPATHQKEVEKKAEIPAGIIYKIQIGAFKGKIPDSTNKIIKKISMIRKVENNVYDKGVKTYTTGNLKSYHEAETMLSQIKQEGVKNAVIIAFQNGKKITVAEARKLNKEL